MRTLFILTLTVVFLCFFQSLEAQTDKSNYSLLWEITGNKLERPSYLFGTMHVRDERAAEFPDSLYIALENVDAYAMEFHPDSMMSFVMELLFPSNTTSLKDRLSPSAYEHLNKAVLKKTGQPLDSLGNQDPSFIEQLLTDFDEPKHTKKKDQIVDLYLYKQAWLMNKMAYGLEELKDYENVTHQFFQMFERNTYQEGSGKEEDLNEQFETMLKLYQSGDIDATQKWLETQSIDEDYDKAMLDTRNQQMVAQMEVLMQKQSVFCAVGTAHLPGQSGMLTLLEKEGYKVRKVKATFEGYNLKIDTEQQYKRWVSTKNEKFGYEIKTPNKLYNFNKFIENDNPALDIKMGMDMLDMNAYILCSVILPEGKGQEWNKEKAKEMINNFNEDGEQILLGQKTIKYSGIKGQEFKFKDIEEDTYSIWRLFMENNVVYLFGVQRQQEDLDAPSVQYFFNNITLSKPLISSTNFERFESKDGGYFINMLSNLRYKRTAQKQQLETGELRDIVIHTYISSNLKTGNYYLMQHNLLGAGVSVEDEDFLLSNSISNIVTEWGSPTTPIKDIQYAGLKGKEAVYELETETVHIRVLLRGNKIYVLIVGLPAPNKAGSLVSDFFNSFELKDHLSMPLSPQTLKKADIQVNLPNPVVPTYIEDQDEEYPPLNEWEYITMDTLNGYSYIITSYQYPPYYEVEDINAFLNNYAQSFANDESTTKFVDTTFQNRRAWYVEFKYDRAPGTTHSLILFNGPNLLEFSLYAPEKADSKKAWEIYNSVKFEKTYPVDYFTSDRSELLLENIQSRDSVTQIEAKIGMDRYQMNAANLPSIYKILEQDFSFDTLQNRSIHDLMFQELLYTQDESTLPFLEQLFRKRASDKDTQEDILITLSNMKNEASYDLFFKLIKDYKKEAFDGYRYDNLFEAMRDTATLTANYYSEILDLRKNQAFQYYSYNLIFSLLVDDVLPIEVVEKDRSIFLNDAKQLIKEYDLLAAKDSLPEMEKYWHLDALHIILGELSADKETDDYLASLLNLTDAKLVSTIIDALLMHKKTVPDYAFETVAEDSYYWKDLLTNLEYEGNLDKIPAALFTQEKTVQSYVYKYLEDEYDELNRFNILEKRAYTYEGEELNLYVFTFAIDGYENEYLGVCSQPLAKDQVNLSPKLFNYSGTAYSSENMETIYRELIELWHSE